MNLIGIQQPERRGEKREKKGTVEEGGNKKKEGGKQLVRVSLCIHLLYIPSRNYEEVQSLFEGYDSFTEWE